MHEQLDAPNQKSKAPHSIKQFLMHFIKPTAFGLVMLVLLLPVSGVVRIWLTDGLYIDWPKAIIAVPILYLLLNGLYNWLAIIGRPLRVFRLYMIMFLAFIGIAFPAASITSKHYWGYYFSPPGAFNELHDVKRVNKIIPVQTKNNEGVYKFFFYEYYVMKKEFKYAKESPYFAFGTRNLLLFESMALDLPEVSGLPPSGLDYYKLVKDTGILVTPDPGYKRSALLHGLIINATDSNGRELVLIAASGGQLSFCYCPYYELLFEKQPGIEKPVLLRSQHYFFGIHGMGDMQWYLIWMWFSIGGGCLAFLLTIIIAVVRGIIRWLAPKFRPPAPAH